MNVKQIKKMIRERIRNYRELHKETKMVGALDKWEALAELEIGINEGAVFCSKTEVDDGR